MIDDTALSRCPGCGAWTYGDNPCTTQPPARREPAHATSTD